MITSHPKSCCVDLIVQMPICCYQLHELNYLNPTSAKTMFIFALLIWPRTHVIYLGLKLGFQLFANYFVFNGGRQDKDVKYC